MDEKWLYGFEPQDIFDTISHGRENGMPAFGGSARSEEITVIGTLPEYQRWQLVAYVRSLSGQAPRDAAPGRSDHMQAKPPENEKERETPVVVKPEPDVVGMPK